LSGSRTLIIRLKELDFRPEICFACSGTCSSEKEREFWETILSQAVVTVEI